MHIAYLLIGGNLGNRPENLRHAREIIGLKAGSALAVSAIYETAAWGNTGQASFLNQLIIIYTKKSAEELMLELLDIEDALGRKRAERYGPRTIDIDILFFDQLILQTALVTIPHPELARRKFALVPLAELAPHYKHPILEKTSSELLAECPDPLDVKKF